MRTRNKLSRKVRTTLKITLPVLAGTVGLWWIQQNGLRPGVTPPTEQTADETIPSHPQFTGSSSCRNCHEEFFRLWAPSFHGLAMRPFSDELARRLIPQTNEIEIGSNRYRVEIETTSAYLRATGKEGERTYPIEHALGGKNVFYFLTPMPRGRLQVLPLAYDVRRAEWFDTTASAVRHFPENPDQALDWTERPLTFNASCYNCHVSQIAPHYDLETDSYRTVWTEPGINCETCHGPGSEHLKVCREADSGPTPEDLRIISIKSFSTEQKTALCAPCHAKRMQLTGAFRPGERYFDHFDLVALEDRDFYPDARDLGENYTFTLWRLNPCAKSGQLDCLHCHTSSGRYRFQGEKANEACLPCHAERVANAEAHTHHPKAGEGGRCIDCHMPTTEFARMRRSDHSFRPPTPAATIAFQSPNACNLCHSDKESLWADALVREWRNRDYQAPVLKRARLIESARKRDWSRLPEILAYLEAEDREEIYVVGLIRLLRDGGDERIWPALIRALQDSSPWVRATAAEALTGRFTSDAVAGLLQATRDGYRLARVRAASALAGLPDDALARDSRRGFENATAELLETLRARPDDSVSHYNLGSFHMSRGEFLQARHCFETAIRLQPNGLPSLINLSVICSALGDNTRAEQCLRQAVTIDPDSAGANLNLGLLLGETERWKEAEAALRRAWKTDPTSAVAAYNLGVIVARDRVDEAIDWCRRARNLLPGETKYAYTLAFYQRQSGDLHGAVATLRSVVEAGQPDASTYRLLGELYEHEDLISYAIEIYRRAAADQRLMNSERHHFAVRLQLLQASLTD